MRPSRVKAKLSRDEPVLVTALHFIDPSLYEMASLMGFDAIWMDMEHHGYSLETANNLMRAARVGTADILARPAKGEFMRMGRMLEAGAQGIMYPRCSSAQEAAEVVKWAKFAPLGRRGFDGGNPDMPYCAMDMAQYTRQANEQTFIVIQLEEPEAIDQADQIAQVEGVDILMLGPADFSVLSGIPGQFDHELVEQATRKIAAAARKAGKHWGRPAASPQDAARFLDMGARLICHGGDIVILKRGLEQIQEQFAALGFSFDNRLSSQTAAYLAR
ncbi:MAG TPA: aldolase/citrate lyase family protein [Phycisphaeraceae bacterium]